MTELAGAGWYPDENPYLLRYWDGAAWTDRTTTRVFAQSVPPRRGMAHRMSAVEGATARALPRRRGAVRSLIPVASGAIIVALLVTLAPALLRGVAGTGRGLADAGVSASPVATPAPARRPFPTCAAARRAGAVPLTVRDPRWNPDLDTDGDGRACTR